MLLGGNIELDGFDTLEPALLVVVKKMVGSEARRISEDGITFDKLKLGLSHSSSDYEVSGKIVFKDKDFDASVNEGNLFFGLDKVLKKLVSVIKNSQ